jgi:predicted nucleotidyltransferase
MTDYQSIKACLLSNESALRGFHVRNIWLFGSAARGEADVNDLDFLVEFSKDPGLVDFMNLKFFLEEQLDNPVDLHSIGSCPPRFYKRIENELKHVA